MSRRLRSIYQRRCNPTSPGTPPDSGDEYVPRPADYPVFPPPAPRDFLRDRAAQWQKMQARKFAAPQGVFEDTSLLALYRLYELILLDRVISYRNALQAFWREKSWAVRDIPNPKDDHPERSAFLAGCTHLLVRSFNARVKLGLSRDMPALLLPEEAEELRNRPDHFRQYEEVPEWARKVPPLAETLVVPTVDGETLNGKDDKRADPDFLSLNILLWTPHIHFT